jgi:hypothetical protein
MNMKRIALYLGIIALTLVSVAAFCQEVTYSEPQRDDDYRNTEVEIIGRVSGNILVYKNNRAGYQIAIFNGDMQLQ